MGHNGCDGSEASGPWAIGSEYRFSTRGFCPPVVAACHEHLCFPICTHRKKKGLPVVPFSIFKTYGCGLAQLVITINFLGGGVKRLPLFTAPK